MRHLVYHALTAVSLGSLVACGPPPPAPAERVVYKYIVVTATPSPSLTTAQLALEQPVQEQRPTQPTPDGPAPPPFIRFGRVHTTANLRTYPSTRYGQVITTVAEGAQVVLKNRNPSGTWYEIITPQVQEGYISASLVDVPPATLAQVPIRTPPPIQTKPRVERPRTAPPRRAPAPKAPSNCDPSYPDICIPQGIPDLDCPDLSSSGFRVIGADRHRFDGDGDGIGCE